MLATGEMRLCGVGGCGRLEPDAAVPLEPPAELRVWWVRTEECSGRQSTFERGQWSVVSGDRFYCLKDRCVGRREDNHTIYALELWPGNEMVIRARCCVT